MPDLNPCKFCMELNEEMEDIVIREIWIRSAGYYNWSCQIYHCPNCGRLLKKYKVTEVTEG